MMNDIIADALTRIRNAAMRKLEVATLLHSNTVVGVLNVLLQKSILLDSKLSMELITKTIQVELKYDDNEKSVINEITRVSKPGRRVYKSASEIKSFKNGYGTIIVSTNKGVIANDEAFAANVGGEVLFYCLVGECNVKNWKNLSSVIPSGIEVTVDGSLISVKKETKFLLLKLMEELESKLLMDKLF